MRLGDLDALLEKVQFRIPCDSAVAAIVNECVKITKHLIENAPTIDAVPVVRCEDCKNRQDPEECPFCFTEVVDVDGGRLYKFNDLTHDDGFCNKGERRCDNDTP